MENRDSRGLVGSTEKVGHTRKVGTPSPCHPLRSAQHRQCLLMPPRPFVMPSSAHRAQGIVKNMDPLSTKTLGSMSGGMKYMPGTTPCCLQAAAIVSKPA